MADEVSGTINVEVLYKAAGGGGGGGGGITGASKASGSTAASAKKHSKYMFDVTKALKTISGAVTIGAVIKQSKVTSSFLGTFFQLMGALVDIFLMPFLPLLIPVMKGMAGLAQWLMRFMDNPGAAIKEALIAIKDLVQDASKGFLAIFTDWDATKDFLGSISLKDIANNALRIGLGGVGLVGLFAASSAIGNVQELLMSKFFGFNPLKKALFTTTDLMLKLFGKSGRIKNMLEALRMWSQPSSLGTMGPSGVGTGRGKGGTTTTTTTAARTGLNANGSRRRVRTPVTNPGTNFKNRNLKPKPPPAKGLSKWLNRAKGVGAYAGQQAIRKGAPQAGTRIGLAFLGGPIGMLAYAVAVMNKDPEWVRAPGWTSDDEKFKVYQEALTGAERLKLREIIQYVPYDEQTAWKRAFISNIFVPGGIGNNIATPIGTDIDMFGKSGNNAIPSSVPSFSDSGYTGNDLDIRITKGENGEWVVEADSNSSFGNFVSQMN
jgi:hypothetical protein